MNVSKITHDGVTRSLKEWAEVTGIPATTILSRINRLRWSVADALTTPVDRRFRKGGRRKKDLPRPCPELKRHPTSGLAYCRWSQDGKERWRYFGPADDPKAKTAYKRFAMEWATGGVDDDRPAGSLFLAELITRWVAHCEATYVKRGRHTSEVHCNRAAMRYPNELYGDTPAAEFDGKRLKAAREAMIREEGWTRQTVNDHVARIVRMFAWAVTEGHVPEGVHRALKLVESIPAGRRADLAENERVDPVPLEHVNAVLAGDHLHPTPARRAVLAAMVRVQLLSGMRPGELCTVRGDEIDRRKTPWRYEVSEFNKMLHKNITRVVFFGPQAREILGPLLAATPKGEPVFRYPPRGKGAKWMPISTTAYRHRIALACESAGVPVWTPNQLRHNKATEVMDRYEDDAAVATLLGNSAEVARQVYAKNPGEGVAKRIAEQTG